jgi:hypothetical protein
MTTRRAACNCGQLSLTIEGEPSRISMCHCLECQRRTGAVISNQARFCREQITFEGNATAWTRRAESGNALTFHFWPVCGSTVYWEGEGFPGYSAVGKPGLVSPSCKNRHSASKAPPSHRKRKWCACSTRTCGPCRQEPDPKNFPAELSCRSQSRAFCPMPHGLEREPSACPGKYRQTFQSPLSTGEAHCPRNWFEV